MIEAINTVNLDPCIDCESRTLLNAKEDVREVLRRHREEARPIRRHEESEQP